MPPLPARPLSLVLPVWVLIRLASAPPLAGQEADPMTPLEPGMTIDRSIRVLPGAYALPAPASPDSAAITIRGDSIAVDFTGVVLLGAAPGTAPDSFSGVAIRIEGGSGVTVRGGTARGYKVGLLARGTRGLRLEGNDFSHNWRQRLESGIERESLVDWMSYHNNEKDEWLRYGAGIYLSNIDGGRIDRNIARQGQNGLMVTRSTRSPATTPG